MRDILSQLLLPVFILMILTMMVGGKPEAVMKAYLDLLCNCFLALLRFLKEVIYLLIELFKKQKATASKGKLSTTGKSRAPKSPDPADTLTGV